MIYLLLVKGVNEKNCVLRLFSSPPIAHTGSFGAMHVWQVPLRLYRKGIAGNYDIDIVDNCRNAISSCPRRNATAKPALLDTACPGCLFVKNSIAVWVIQCRLYLGQPPTPSSRFRIGHGRSAAAAERVGDSYSHTAHCLPTASLQRSVRRSRRAQHQRPQRLPCELAVMVVACRVGEGHRVSHAVPVWNAEMYKR